MAISAADGEMPQATGTPRARDTHRLAITLLLAATGISCGRSGPPRVAVIGDSITAISADDLRAAGSEFRFQIDAVFGATSLEMLDDARDLAERDPDQVIINLGTNDALGDTDPFGTVEVLQKMVDLFPNAACVHLVTINQSMTYGRPAVVARATAINRGIRDLDQRSDRVRTIDWNHTLASAATVEGNPLLNSDTIHPTERGQKELTQSYRNALNSCPHS